MRTFTLEEANALVPMIADLLEHVTETRNKLIIAGEKVQAAPQRAGGNGGNKAGSEYALLLQHLNALLNTFKEWGIELKDIDEGLVDFPSYREGRIVYLCWKRGETRIEFWHDLEAGFGGRQPV